MTHSGVLLQPLVRPRKRSDYPATALAADKTPALAEKSRNDCPIAVFNSSQGAARKVAQRFLQLTLWKNAVQPPKTGALQPTWENDAPLRLRYRKVISSLFKSATGRYRTLLNTAERHRTYLRHQCTLPALMTLIQPHPTLRIFKLFLNFFQTVAQNPSKNMQKRQLKNST